jgi:hypothetical protein
MGTTRFLWSEVLNFFIVRVFVSFRIDLLAIGARRIAKVQVSQRGEHGAVSPYTLRRNV